MFDVALCIKCFVYTEKDNRCGTGWDVMEMCHPSLRTLFFSFLCASMKQYIEFQSES